MAISPDLKCPLSHMSQMLAYVCGVQPDLHLRAVNVLDKGMQEPTGRQSSKRMATDVALEFVVCMHYTPHISRKRHKVIIVTYPYGSCMVGSINQLV